MKINYKEIIKLLKKKNISKETYDFASFEFSHGFSYHIKTLDRLGFSGDNALDAGSGVGNWSIALKSRYKNVTAIDFNIERLNLSKEIFEYLNLDIKTKNFNLEKRIPLNEKSYDLIFCNGVIFLTNYEKSLLNLKKLLKKNGIIYFTFCEFGWWKYLIEKRIPQEPNIKNMIHQQLLNSIQKFLRDSFFKKEEELVDSIIIRMILDNLTSTFLRKFNIIKNFSMHTIVNFFKKYQKAKGEQIYKVSVNEDIDKWLYFFNYALQNFESDHKKIFENSILKYITKKKDKFENSDGGYFISKSIINDFLIKNEFNVISILKQNQTILNLEHNYSIKPVYKNSLDVFEVICSNKYFNTNIFNISKFLSNYDWIAKNVKYFLHEKTISNNFSLQFEELNKILKKRSNLVNKKSFFHNLLKMILENYGQNELFFKIYYFLQSSLFHHPFYCLRNSDGTLVQDPVSVILSGVAHCTQAAIITRELYNFAGFKSRIMKLNNHTVCEVNYKGKWRYVDVDFFKFGVFPTNKNNQWLSSKEAKETPFILDNFAASGIQLSKKSKWFRNYFNEIVKGYVDFGLSWERNFYSSFISGKIISPPKPLDIKIIRKNGNIYLFSEDKRNEDIFINVMVSKRSRGWSYNDIPNKNYLNYGFSESYKKKIFVSDINNGVKLGLKNKNQKLYLNYSTGSELKNDAYYWPADEIVI